MLTWTKQQSFTRPIENDFLSSKKKVFFRRNVYKKGDSWVYDESKIDKDVYESSKSEIDLEIKTFENSPESISQMIAASVKIDETPIVEKEGYITVRKYITEENRITYTLEPDPNYHPEIDGSDFLKAIPFVDGMWVESGKWYKNESCTWEAKKDGIPETFGDSYFDTFL